MSTSPLCSEPCGAASPSGEPRSGSEGGEAAVGLSLFTKLTATRKIKCYSEGAYIEIKPVGGRGPKRPGKGAVREKCTTFSGRSRRGLKTHFHQLNKQVTSRCLFVTLTYHVNMRDARQAKRHLDTFDKRLAREYPKSGIVWKMECQKRGSIHFHLLVFGVKFIPCEWVAKAWGDIVAPGEEAQKQAGTETKAANNFWEARHYLEKYIGKQVEGEKLEEPGRYWGVRRLERFVSPVVEVELTESQAARVARILDKWHKAKLRSAWFNRTFENLPESMQRTCYEYCQKTRWKGMRVLHGYMLRAAKRRRKLSTRPDWAGGLLVASSVRWWDTPAEGTMGTLLAAVLSA